MRSKTISASKQVEKQKEEIILGNPQISMETSVEYFKKLTVVAISTISFLRQIFPLSAFKDRKLNGMALKILRGSDNIPGTMAMTNWLKSAINTLHSHCLKKIILVIESPLRTEEIYTFNFSYNDEAINCELSSKYGKEITMETTSPDFTNIKRSTQQLIRSVLAMTTTLQPLPDNCQVSMKLEFNENTPEDFELPEHFIAVDSLGIDFPPFVHTLKLGKIETTFTTFSVSTKTLCNEQEENNENLNEIEDEMVLSSQSPSMLATSLVSSTANPEPDKANELQETETPALSETLSEVNPKGIELKCICECNDDSGVKIKCTSCSTFQHTSCYKLMDNQKVEKHICVNCHEPDNPAKTCTDLDLVNDKNRKFGALYRRALLLCLTVARVSSNTFVTHFGINRQGAQKLFDRLDIDGCLHSPTGRGNVRTIKIDHLKDNVISMYFNDPNNKIDETSIPMDIGESEFTTEIEKPMVVYGKRNFIEDQEDLQHNSHSSFQPKRLRYASIEGPSATVLHG